MIKITKCLFFLAITSISTPMYSMRSTLSNPAENHIASTKTTEHIIPCKQQNQKDTVLPTVKPLKIWPLRIKEKTIKQTISIAIYIKMLSDVYGIDPSNIASNFYGTDPSTIKYQLPEPQEESPLVKKKDTPPPFCPLEILLSSEKDTPPPFCPPETLLFY